MTNDNPKAHRPISHELSISTYAHCGRCLKEKPDNVSPKEWSRTQTGMTPIGLQVWCNRHDCNVCHIDFEGVVHPANTTCAKVEK